MKLEVALEVLLSIIKNRQYLVAHKVYSPQERLGHDPSLHHIIFQRASEETMEIEVKGWKHS